MADMRLCAMPAQVSLRLPRAVEVTYRLPSSPCPFSLFRAAYLWIARWNWAAIRRRKHRGGERNVRAYQTSQQDEHPGCTFHGFYSPCVRAPWEQKPSRPGIIHNAFSESSNTFLGSITYRLWINPVVFPSLDLSTIFPTT